MLHEYKKSLQDVLAKAVTPLFPADSAIPALEIEVPVDRLHGEFSCTIALRCARLLKKNPLTIAAEIVPLCEAAIHGSPLAGTVSRIEVKAPGFINFYLAPQAFYSILTRVFADARRYGAVDIGGGKKVMIEFVSANPTGPLSVAHARQAAVGDALVNILNFAGFKAKREYYVNDGGNQINILGKSVLLRGLQILGKSVEFPDDCYQGEYIKDMAQLFLDTEGIKNADVLEKRPFEDVRSFAVTYLLDVIRKELDDFGVHFDQWSYESAIATPEAISATIAQLTAKKLTYENEGALWFKSTDFGDDKDRVIRKSDGAYTYLMPDIVYHKHKFDRGFDHLYDILGPDHHGYIARIKAAAEAVGKGRDSLDVLIVQLATVYRNGEAVSMSTRRGQYISLREVIDEVGVDAARFFFLMRHISAHLDFDLDLAKKETPENPVYYIQYAHARIHSIHLKADQLGIRAQIRDFALLTTAEEIDLMKTIGGFSEAIQFCCDQKDPYALTSYLQELATSFHKFYDSQRVLTDDVNLSSQRLGLVDAVRMVLANGLRLLGVSTPTQM